MTEDKEDVFIWSMDVKQNLCISHAIISSTETDNFFWTDLEMPITR